MDNEALLESFWKVPYERDWERVASFSAPDGHYEDVPAPDPDVALAHRRVRAPEFRADDFS